SVLPHNLLQTDAQETSHVEYIKIGQITQDRSPKRTHLSQGLNGVWFLLHRGQWHRRLTTPASALPSTGVSTLRRTVGELGEIDGRVAAAVHSHATNLATYLATYLAMKASVSKGQHWVYPATARTRLAAWLPAAYHHNAAAIPRGLVDELPPELREAHISDGLCQRVVLEQAR